MSNLFIFHGFEGFQRHVGIPTLVSDVGRLKNNFFQEVIKFILYALFAGNARFSRIRPK